jgi:hypothetical protein
MVAAAVAVLAFAFAPAHVKAQQAYPSYPQAPTPALPYGANGNPYSGNPYSGSPYAGQYTQPAPQYGSGQPQYPQPAYQQPQYQQPQYAPQQPDAQQPYSQAQPYSEPTSPYPQQDSGQPAAPVQALSAQDLDQLLAPIALYPDSLLAQILAASTYPAQVAVADQWLQQMRAQGYGSSDQIAAGANAQTTWDPSIKALTAFPDVLDTMDQNLEWTTNLGNAYYNQPQDVMQTVQVLRESAEQAGNLQSTPQEEVNNDQGYVELQPTNPDVVYVPTYNPWDVYGEPIAPYPGFAFFGPLGDFYGDVPIQYGLGFALGAFDQMPFGWQSWGCDWAGQGLMFNHSGYYSHSNQVADWGLPRGGPRAHYGRGGNGGMRDGQNRSYDQRQGYNQGGGNQHGGWSNNRGPGQSFVRPAERFPEPGRLSNNYNNLNRGYQYNRGNQQPSYGTTRPAMPGQQTYNRPAQQNYGYRPQTYPNRTPAYTNPGYSSRPQNYSNPGYRYGYTGQTTNTYPGNGYSRNSYSAPQAYATRPGFAYSNPSSSYRAAPQSNNSRGFSNRSYENYGNSTAQNQHSGGFHLFGGGQSRSFSSQRAPSYSYQAPKNFGGGHQSFGGGHQSFGGGHQSFGGGHQSFGGGHMSAPKASHSSGGGGNRRR